MDLSHSFDSNSSLSSPLTHLNVQLPLSSVPLVPDFTPVSPVEPAIYLESEICRICESELEVKTAVALGRCDHVFCEECFRDYLVFRVSERKVKEVTCPAFNCPVTLYEEELKQYLDPPDYDKYQRFLREAELEQNPDLRWCPKVNCTGYDYGAIDKHKLNCCVCHFAYCFYCLEPWHSANKCKAEAERRLDRWAKTHNAKFCPRCRARIEKQLGCNHMTCVRCRYEFCWLCGETFQVSHIGECPVTRMRKKNPPWPFCIGVLLLPLLMPFAFVILMLVYMRKYLQESRPIGCFYYFLKKWYLSGPVLIVLALILTPLFFTLVVLCTIGAYIIHWGRYAKYDSSSVLHCLARRVCFWKSIAVILSVMLGWIVVVGMLAGLALGRP